MTEPQWLQWAKQLQASLQSKKLAPSQFKKFLRVWQYNVEQDR